MLFDARERANKLGRKPQLADWKILHCARRLRAVIRLCGDRHFAHRVAFNSRRLGHKYREESRTPRSKRNRFERDMTCGIAVTYSFDKAGVTRLLSTSYAVFCLKKK